MPPGRTYFPAASIILRGVFFGDALRYGCDLAVADGYVGGVSIRGSDDLSVGDYRVEAHLLPSSGGTGILC